MSAVEVTTITNATLTTGGASTEKIAIMTSVEPVASSTNTNEKDAEPSDQSNSRLPENESKETLPETEGSSSTKEKEGSDEDDGKSAISVSAGETVALDEMFQKLLKKVEFMKKKLEDELSITLDEPEEKKEEDVVEEPVAEAEPEEEKAEENKVEETFSLDKQIKYILSEKWCDKDSRTHWTSYSGTTIVVSMKQKGINRLHAPVDSLVQDHPHPLSELLQNTSQLGIQKEDLKPENDMENCRPDRVAIVCPILLAEVNKITGANLSNSANVILPPYKILVPFHHEFSECLQAKDAIYKILLEEQKALETSSPNEAVNVVADETKTETEVEKNKKVLSSEKQLELKTAQKVANGIKCLLHFMDSHLQDLNEVYRHINDHTLKEIKFENLWYLFKAGDVVVSHRPKDQAYRVLHVGGGRLSRGYVDEKGEPILKRQPKKWSDFFIDCYKMDFNGTHYGPVAHQITISPYDGLRQIAALDVVPISFVPGTDEGSIEDILLARGKKFVRLARVSHKKYKGINLKEGPFRREEVCYLSYLESVTRKLTPLTG